jgi:hypothetical protein
MAQRCRFRMALIDSRTVSRLAQSRSLTDRIVIHHRQASFVKASVGERRVALPPLLEGVIMLPAELKTEALLLCPNCNLEMRLFGTKQDSVKRDLYTFAAIAKSGVA